MTDHGWSRQVPNHFLHFPALFTSLFPFSDMTCECHLLAFLEATSYFTKLSRIQNGNLTYLSAFRRDSSEFCPNAPFLILVYKIFLTTDCLVTRQFQRQLPQNFYQHLTLFVVALCNRWTSQSTWSINWISFLGICKLKWFLVSQMGLLKM